MSLFCYNRINFFFFIDLVFGSLHIWFLDKTHLSTLFICHIVSVCFPLQLHSLSFFVLDEADRMIENGHFRELQSIIDMLPMASGSIGGQSQSSENCQTLSNMQIKKRQTFVFSATIALSADFRKKLKRGSLKSKQSMADGLNSIEMLSERAGMRANAAIIDLTNASILANKLEESFIEYVSYTASPIRIFITAKCKNLSGLQATWWDVLKLVLDF
jgi:ATP-dependent RNA helicase DDX24/MAK5